MATARTAFGLGLYGVTDDTSNVWEGVPFIIEELTGRRRRLELTGRALPEGTLDLETNRRVQTTWYPGQTLATNHILGYDEGSTTVNGEWDTYHLQSNDYAVIDEGGIGLRVESTEDLRELVQSIVKAGQEVSVQWAGIERRAAAMRFRISHRNRGQARWQMDFDWSGASKFAALPIVDQAQAASESLFDTLAELLALAALPAQIAADALDFADLALRRTEALLVEARQVIDLYVAGATNAASVAARAVGIFDTLHSQARAVRDAVVGLPAEAAIRGELLSGASASTAMSEVLDWIARTKRLSTLVAAQSAAQRDVFIELANPRVEGVLTVQGDTDLRFIAQQRYGNPEAWTQIADANNLQTSKVSGGTVLVIPRLQRAA